MNGEVRSETIDVEGRPVLTIPTQMWRVLAVLRFEMNRTRTVPRMLVWCLLASFPVAMMAAFRYLDAQLEEGDKLTPDVLGTALYMMIPQVVCLLGLLIWVAPLINSEIEGRTWVYVAVRPGAKHALLVGKYLNGLLWTCSAAWVGLTAGLIVGPVVQGPEKLWFVLALLSVLACLEYGAAYALIGALFQKRAVVVCVGYVLIFEFLISNIPAVVNQLTVQHRLLNLLFGMMGWSVTGLPLELSDQTVAHHLLVLAVYVLVLFALAAGVLRFREYPTADEA